MRSLRIAGLLLAGLLAAGCSGRGTTGDSGPSGAPDSGDARKPRVSEIDLKRIGLAYQNHVDAKTKGPAKADDLGPYLENDKRLLDLLISGEIVFSYNVNYAAMSEFGVPATVLAYVKDVPEKGGWVLMGDATPKKMSADEFKKAHIAKGKP
jgi:hypothetical protein